MTDTLHCIRDCVRWDKHMPDCPGTDDNPCPGCQPREVETGWLCTRCLDRLHTLLGPPSDRESIAGACLWLADNLGQHIKHSNGGKPSGDGSTHGEHMVTVMAVMSDLQLSLVEMAGEFRQARQMRAATETDPTRLTAWLRPWLTTLADWEPIGDQITHLSDLMADAHAAAPWRGKDPDASDRAAVLLWGAPAEATRDVCDRFGRTSEWLRKAKERGKIQPLDPTEKPLRWMPWDVFRLLHPVEAERYEARMAKLTRAEAGVVWSSEDTHGEAVA